MIRLKRGRGLHSAVADVRGLVDAGFIHEKADAPPTGFVDVRGVLGVLRPSRAAGFGADFVSELILTVRFDSHRIVLLPLPFSEPPPWLLRRSSPLLVFGGRDGS